MRRFRQWVANLWLGRVPLARAFWGYAIVGGLIINLYATLLELAVVASGGPPALAAALHLAPIPWIVLVAVGVWRSAGHLSVDAANRALARGATVAWSLLLAIV